MAPKIVCKSKVYILLLLLVRNCFSETESLLNYATCDWETYGQRYCEYSIDADALFEKSKTKDQTAQSIGIYYNLSPP